VYGFITQQIAEVIPEAVALPAIQKVTLYDVDDDFRCITEMIM
jgi:hypothetical protein